MEHVPLVVDSSFTALVWSLIFVGGVLGLAGAAGQAIAKRKLWWYVTMGVGFLLLSVVVFLLAYSPSSYTKSQATWQETVSKQLSERYDTTVTVENLEDLEYPEVAPEGRVAYGTTTLKSGREVALVLNDGRVYLRIIGEELPFD